MSDQTQNQSGSGFNPPEVEPGDPITADLWNGAMDAVGEALENIDADKVDGFDASASPEPNQLLALNDDAKLPADITGDAGSVGGNPADAFVLKSQLPDAGRITYRRYFKRLEPPDVLVIEHEMAAFPLVDVYELEPLPAEATEDKGTVVGEPVFFYLYYGHEEPDRKHLRTQDRTRKWWPWGTWPPPRKDPYSLDWLLQEAGVEYEDDDTLGDIVNEFWDAFFSGEPNDWFEHGTSEWVDGHRSETVAKLRKTNEWPDIRLAVLPRKVFCSWYGINVAADPDAAALGALEPLLRDHVTLTGIRHLSYDTLELRNYSFSLTGGENDEPVKAEQTAANLMIILKV